MKQKPLWQLALRHLLWYSVEACIALIGWTYGFGLEVKNWWILIGTLIIARWLLHTLQSAWMFEEAKQRAASEAPVDLPPQHFNCRCVVAHTHTGVEQATTGPVKKDWRGCPDCFGSGGPKRKPCATCNGTGRVQK